MRLLFLMPLCILLSFSLTSAAQEINWMSFQDAIEAQKKDPKKIVMDAYTTWCGPCKLYDRTTFSDPDIVAFINTHFYAVKFDAEGTETISYKGKQYNNPRHIKGRKGRNTTHEFARALGVSKYPTLVFFDKQANFLQTLIGYRPPENLILYLKYYQPLK